MYQLKKRELLAKGFQRKLALLAKIHEQSLRIDAQNLYFSSRFVAFNATKLVVL